MANPSPDEGVRAALEADIMLLDDLYKWLNQQWIGLDRELSEGSLGRDTFNMRERVYAVWSASRRALFTPVPEDELPRGTASAAEGKLLAAARKALAFYDGLNREHDPGEAEVLDALDTAVRVTYLLQGGQFGIEPTYCVLGLGDIEEPSL